MLVERLKPSIVVNDLNWNKAGFLRCLNEKEQLIMEKGGRAFQSEGVNNKGIR